MKMNNVRIIQLRDIVDPDNVGRPRGHLTPIEEMSDVPFEIKRVYYLTRVPENTSRGYHSHKELEQILICLNGNIKIRITDGKTEDVIVLSNPAEGLYIGPMIWREMYDFSPGSVLLVLASEHYNESDYIRNYDEYIKLCEE